MLRTGSTRAQPRSLAGAGTTAPRSGYVCGRGASQCHAFLTRARSPSALPAMFATFVAGPRRTRPSCSVPLLDAVADLLGRGLAVGGGHVEGDDRDLELVLLPEGRVKGLARDRELDEHGVVAETGLAALLDRPAGGLDVLQVGVGQVEVLLVDLEVGGRRGHVLEADGVDLRDLAAWRVSAEVAAVRGARRVDGDVGVVGAGGLQVVEVLLVGLVLGGVLLLLGLQIAVPGARSEERREGRSAD